MAVKGLMYSCARCGKEQFCKVIGKVDHDGGFSPSTEKYESIPDTWMTIYDMNIGGTLCPDCAKVVKDFFAGFYGKEIK